MVIFTIKFCDIIKIKSKFRENEFQHFQFLIKMHKNITLKFRIGNSLFKNTLVKLYY